MESGSGIRGELMAEQGAWASTKKSKHDRFVYEHEKLATLVQKNRRLEPSAEFAASPR
jgi:hypothetical protein